MGLLFSKGGPSIESIAYLRDTSANLTLDEVKDSYFSEITEDNLGDNNGVYWFRIQEISSPRAILEMRTSHAKGLELFDSDGKIVYLMDGTRFPSFFLTKKRLSYPLYLRTIFPLEAHFPIHISDEMEFAQYEKRSLLSIGFFNGTGLALIIATLVFFFIVRNTQFLFFALLTLAILLSVFARDNVLYLFGVRNNISIYLELIGHYTVGLFATGFMIFYLRLKESQLWVKWSMLVISGLSTVFLLAFIITKELWFFSLVNITSVATTLLMWFLVLIIVKGIRRLSLLLIYSANSFFLVNIFILHLFGLAVIEVSPATMALVAAANFTLIAAMLLHSFNGMQIKEVMMSHKIKRYVEELKELSVYKSVQDTNDDYMETLIYEFKLENIEVKVLQEISAGQSNYDIARTLNLTPERLQDITTSLFLKMGIDDSKDVLNLPVP